MGNPFSYTDSSKVADCLFICYLFCLPVLNFGRCYFFVYSAVSVILTGNSVNRAPSICYILRIYTQQLIMGSVQRWKGGSYLRKDLLLSFGSML